MRALKFFLPAVVAFALAEALERVGEDVALLAMFDAPRIVIV